MSDEGTKPEPRNPLKEAMRAARIQAAERSAVVVELRDAEAARLEMLNEAVTPVFAEIPAEHLDLFDRGLSQGTTPRLWLDNVAHVAMGRDKRTYRLMTDTVHGRRVLAESGEIEPMVDAITRYVAGRVVARERALAGGAGELLPKSRGKILLVFIVGAVLGAAALFFAALLLAPN